MSRPIIAFTGRAGSGKSTAAAMVVKHPNARRAAVNSFAKPLKQMLIGLLSYALNSTHEGQRLATDPTVKEKPIPELGGVTPRFLLQTLGTEWGREAVDPDFWVYVAAHRADRNIRSGLGMVFDDCRFENEASLIRRLGGIVIGVKGRENPDVPQTHASEAGVEPDFWVFNDQTLDHLQKQIDEIVNEHFARETAPPPPIHLNAVRHCMLFAQHPEGTVHYCGRVAIYKYMLPHGLIEVLDHPDGVPKRQGYALTRLTAKGRKVAAEHAATVDLADWNRIPKDHVFGRLDESQKDS